MKILMIEDDKELCEVTAAQLQNDGYETQLCYDGEEGLYHMVQGCYDMVILDRMLPGLDGLTILSKAREDGITTPVLLLTALGTVNDRVNGLESGADDYLVKPFDYRELLARIRALVRRPAQIVSKEELRFGDLLLDTSSLALKGDKSQCSLSKKEADLLAILMKSEGQTLPRSTLFARVWSPDADVEEANLDGYAYFLRRRLAAVSNRVRLLTVRGIGYRLEEV